MVLYRSLPSKPNALAPSRRCISKHVQDGDLADASRWSCAPKLGGACTIAYDLGEIYSIFELRLGGCQQCSSIGLDIVSNRRIFCFFVDLNRSSGTRCTRIAGFTLLFVSTQGSAWATGVCRSPWYVAVCELSPSPRGKTFTKTKVEKATRSICLLIVEFRNMTYAPRIASVRLSNVPRNDSNEDRRCFRERRLCHNLD